MTIFVPCLTFLPETGRGPCGSRHFSKGERPACGGHHASRLHTARAGRCGSVVQARHEAGNHISYRLRPVLRCRAGGEQAGACQSPILTTPPAFPFHHVNHLFHASLDFLNRLQVACLAAAEVLLAQIRKKKESMR